MKLFQFTFFIIVNSLCCIIANAQIVYTDVIPDSTISTNGGMYNLDLNNDGIIDFTFKVYHSVVGCAPLGYSHGSGWVRILPSGSNQVADTILNHPNPLNLNTVIGNGISFWSNDSLQTLRSFFRNCGSSIVYSGYWIPTGDHYLGLKLIGNFATYFGWVRLDVHAFSLAVIGVVIKDYAYNSIADQPILAGDTGRLQTSIPEMQTSMNFNLSPNPANDNFTLTLNQAPSNATIQIFNAVGEIIYNEVLDKKQETLNSVQFSTGVYFVKVFNKEKQLIKKLIIK